MADIAATPRRPASKRAIAPAPVITASPMAPATAKDTAMNDTVKQITDKVQADSKEAFAKMTSDGKAAFEKMSDEAKTGFAKGRAAFGDVAEFNRGNVEAMIESARIAGKGLETMAQQSAAYATTSYDKGAAALKSMVAVSSPTELVSLQSEYVRTAFDDLVAETSRSTEAALKLAGEIARPLQNRFALAAAKMKAAA